MLGGTETTFYVISVYFGTAGIRRTKHAIPAALAADLVGFLCAGIFVRLFLYWGFRRSVSCLTSFPERKRR